MKNIRTDTYSQGNTDSAKGLKKFFMRLGRKLTFWYVNPFGTGQNEFNSEMVKMTGELEKRQSSAERRSVEMRSEILDRISLIESRLNLKIQERQRETERLEGVLNSYIVSFAPETRVDKNSDGVFMPNIQEKNPESVESMEKWGEDYRQEVLEKLRKNDTRSPIVVICQNFIVSDGMEAIRNEAVQIYRLLRKSSVYPIKFISIESSLEQVLQRGEVTCIPEKGAGKFVESLRPTLCIFCERTAHIVCADGCSMLLNRSLLKLSGQNPLDGITPNTLNELLHLNDMGLHKYLVESERAVEIMCRNGFRKPDVSYPITEGEKVAPRNKFSNPENFVVGFASSPMKDSQLDDRGVNILCEVIKKSPSVRFKILWRYDSAKIPTDMESLENCEIIHGKCDMNSFYSDIDCLIIPYKSPDFNHACSLSAVEAMQNCIPVICTDVSGVSEVVRFCGMGEVCSTDSDEICRAVEKMKMHCESYISPINKQRLDNLLDSRRFVEIVEREAEKSKNPEIRPVTLHKWNAELVKNDKYLVKGHSAMKEYYQQQEIAEKYTLHRFTSPALKYFDFIERQNIAVILEHFSSCQKFKELNIIDIACGDGRITEECLRHGNCTSADASPAMLEIVKQRFENAQNKPETLPLDVITDEISGSYDAVTCFRYVRHFSYPDRKIIYSKFRNLLRESGIVIMDVPNINFEIPLKNSRGWGNYNIYDVFWTIEDFKAECEENGFRLVYAIPTGAGLMSDDSSLPKKIKNIPMTWTVGMIKI